MHSLILAVAVAALFGGAIPPEPERKPMNLFNAFQITTVFGAAPLIYVWLEESGYLTRYWSLGMFWGAYIALFIYMVGCVRNGNWLS